MKWNGRTCLALATVAALFGALGAPTARAQGKKPNIVFILLDNVGWGDFSVYGGSTPTPRIDKLASEGIRFNNYTVESQCTPSRSAIMTGRQSVRSGTFRVPYPAKVKAGLRLGSTRLPNCSRTLVTRRRCGVSGISVMSRAGCRPTRASTNGGAIVTPPTRQATRLTLPTERSPRPTGLRLPNYGRARRGRSPPQSVSWT